MARTQEQIRHLAATHMTHALESLVASLETRLLHETGFRLIDSEALRILDDAQDPLRMSDIAARLVVSRAGATKVVDRLEAQSLVRRALDATDRRSYLVTITDDGRAALARHRPVVDAAIEAMWSRHLTPHEAATILDVADRVAAANQEWYER